MPYAHPFLVRDASAEPLEDLGPPSVSLSRPAIQLSARGQDSIVISDNEGGNRNAEESDEDSFVPSSQTQLLFPLSHSDRRRPRSSSSPATVEEEEEPMEGQENMLSAGPAASPTKLAPLSTDANVIVVDDPNNNDDPDRTIVAPSHGGVSSPSCSAISSSTHDEGSDLPPRHRNRQLLSRRLSDSGSGAEAGYLSASQSTVERNFAPVWTPSSSSSTGSVEGMGESL